MSDVTASSSDTNLALSYDTAAIYIDVAPVTDKASGQQQTASLSLMVDGIHCGGCVRKIERSLESLSFLNEGKVNFSTRRLRLVWQGGLENLTPILEVLNSLGFQFTPYNPDAQQQSDKKQMRHLLSCIAVSGFAAANIMLLSVGIWAGLAEDMGPATRNMFYWISAMICIPTVLYAGQPFYRSALKAISVGRVNMDVPISLAVLLAVGMSMHETVIGGDHAYFDSAATLLFFLLIGRTLDQQARGKARSAAQRLLNLSRQPVTRLTAEGKTVQTLPEHLSVKDHIIIPRGQRIAADAIVISGDSDIDMSLLNGETLPKTVTPGDKVYTGTLNLTQSLTLEVEAVGENTVLADIVRLMEQAEQRKTAYVRLADRVAGYYAPVVHLLAAITFIMWWQFLGADWQVSLLHAVAVLIITCPCALGLAVPIVQVVTSAALMARGIVLKDGSALERGTKITHILFDKTGTLTLGQPQLVNRQDISDANLSQAAQMAITSHHPLSRAIIQQAGDQITPCDNIEEHAGKGLLYQTPDGETWRLGSAAWCDIPANDQIWQKGPSLWFCKGNDKPVAFHFEDKMRPDAPEIMTELKQSGYHISLLSGDLPESVANLANTLNLSDWHAQQTPEDKLAFITALQKQGHQVMMVGDGLNDAPSLAAADLSVSPANAADISQISADVIFQGQYLRAIPQILYFSKKSTDLVIQNISMSFLYNLVTVPLAMAGFVSPLIAAIAMSSSSLCVTLNSLRLNLIKR